jgi:hypothetical protein
LTESVDALMLDIYGVPVRADARPWSTPASNGPKITRIRSRAFGNDPPKPFFFSQSSASSAPAGRKDSAASRIAISSGAKAAASTAETPRIQSALSMRQKAP